MTGKWKWSS